MKQRRTKKRAEEDKKILWEKIIREGREYPAGVKQYFLDKKISKGSYYIWLKRLLPSHPEWQALPRKSGTGKAEDAATSEKSRPETEVREKASRRKFSREYKARILSEVDSAPQGQIASILRREGLYSSHLAKWRQERDERGLKAQKRGPKVNPLANENKRLREENARLQKKLGQANDIIDVQKKLQKSWV
jgi:transposase-like protein